ncbi:unnamed protein product [Cuscuta campestris]|uniref:Uncharacterized protein n=1 Tax=Cuscuta campestris TaxID=132261 RepID=A0A484NRV4_9ASTE|nr:unnamed protein product [Cuscuta campestris]
MENLTQEERTVSSQVDCDVAATPIVSSNLPTGPDIVHVQPPGVNRVFRSDVWDHFFPYWIRNKKYEKDMETQKLVEVITWKMRAKLEAKTTQIKTLLFSMYEAYDEEVQGKNHLKRKRLAEITNDLVKRQKASYKVGSSTSKNMFVVDWTKYVEQTDESIITHEVDKYLNDPLEGIGKNKNKEAINDEDSGLNDEANWLKGDDITTHFDVEPCIEELEFYEAIETESASGRETYSV